MGVQLIIDGENGAIAAQELLTFVRVIQGAGSKTETAGPSPAQKAMNDAPKPEPEATKPAVDAAKEEKAAPAAEEKQPEKQEEKQPETASEDVGSRRASRSRKKKDEPAVETEAPKAEAAPAAEQPAFNPPPGVHDQLADNEAAPKEVQEKAKAMVDDLAPKGDDAPSVNYCRAMLLYLATVKGMDAGRKIFDSMKIAGIKALPPEKFADFITEAKKALAA